MAQFLFLNGGIKMAIRVRFYANKKSYQAVVRINGHRLSKHFERKVDAERWERKQLGSRDSGKNGSVPSLSLEQFAEEWLGVYSTKVRPSTLALTKHILKNFVLQTLGNCRLDRISSREVNLLVSEIIQSGKSVRYANMIIQLIRKMFNDAANDWGYLIQNPASKIKFLKESPQKLNFWTAAEAEAFLKIVKANHPAYHSFFVLLLNTGCRAGEAFALQWSDLDLSKRIVCFRRTVDRINHKVQESTKGNKIRYVGLNEACIEAFRDRKKFLLPISGETLVFPNKVGNLLHHSVFQRFVFDPAIKKSEVRKIRVHDLRHTFAAHFVMNGGSIYDLKQILGHSDIQMTERYAHLAPDYLRGRTSILNFR